MRTSTHQVRIDSNLLYIYLFLVLSLRGDLYLNPVDSLHQTRLVDHRPSSTLSLVLAVSLRQAATVDRGKHLVRPVRVELLRDSGANLQKVVRGR